MSLRVKLFLALMLLPTIALSLFLWLAIEIFENDKVAYIFESSLAVSETKAAQVRSELNRIRAVAATLASRTRLNSPKALNTNRSFFRNQRNVTAFGLISLKRGQKKFNTLISLKKSINDFRQYLRSRELNHLRKNAFVLKAVDVARKIFMVGFEIREKQFKSRVFAILLIKSQELFRAFNDSRAYSTFLVTQDGQVIISPANFNQNNSALKATSLAKEVLNSNFKVGTKEYLAAHGNRYLVSFSNVEIGNLAVLSAVEKKMAMNAIHTLINKAIYVFGALLLSTILLSILTSRKMTTAFQNLFLATRKVSEGDFKVKVKVEGNDEVGKLAESFNVMAKKVEALIDETKEKARMESELRTARTVQHTLFPVPTVRLGPVEISGFYEPASECGGDWWFCFDDEENVFVCIGDATGHGAPAALLTSAARAATSVIHQSQVKSVSEIVGYLNNAIYDTSRGQMMMTFFMIKIEKETGLLTYVNASHDPPMLLKVEKAKNITKKSYLHLMENNNPRLGEEVDIHFTESSYQLTEGDRIVLYTDGVYDARNTAGVNLGTRRMVNLFSSSLEKNVFVHAALTNLVEGIQQWRQGQILEDDVTLVLLRLSSENLEKMPVPA